MMRRTSAFVQIVIILLVVGYGTYHLYRGNFEVSMSTLPFLVAYYLFVVVRQRRNKERDDDEQCGAGDRR
jgi:Ca2+/Na+ antiporter